VALAARRRSFTSDGPLSPIRQHSILLPTSVLEIDSDPSIPVDGTEMCGLVLRGKFSEDHPIARGISDRGGLYVV